MAAFYASHGLQNSEGGTFAGPLTKEFKVGSFALAAENSISIIPTAIEYQYVTDAWTDGVSMMGHFIRTFGRLRTFVTIRFGEPIVGEDAAILLAKTQAYINENLKELRGKYDA